MLYRVYLHLTVFICLIVSLSELQKYYSKDIHNIFCILNTWYFSMHNVYFFCVPMMRNTSVFHHFKKKSRQTHCVVHAALEFMVPPASGSWK